MISNAFTQQLLNIWLIQFMWIFINFGIVFLSLSLFRRIARI